MRSSRAALSLMLLAAPALAAPPGAQPVAGREQAPVREAMPSGMDPQAIKVLRNMSNYMANLHAFEVRAQSADEVVLKSGDKMQVLADSHVAVERPNKMRSDRLGQVGPVSFVYDGKTFTLVCKNTNTYATVPAPPNIDAAIDLARKKYDIDAPGADLLYSNPYQGLTEMVTRSKYIGLETVNNQPAHHIMFMGKALNYQLWVADGPQPLPLRYVITDKTLPNQPQFTVNLTNWQPQANFTSTVFQFQPPPGATRSPQFPPPCPIQ